MQDLVIRKKLVFVLGFPIDFLQRDLARETSVEDLAINSSCAELFDFGEVNLINGKIFQDFAEITSGITFKRSLIQFNSSFLETKYAPSINPNESAISKQQENLFDSKIF